MGALTREPGRSDDRARDLLLLDSLPGVGPRRVLGLVQAFGGASAALGTPFRAFAEIAGDAAARARSDRALADEIDRALERAYTLGMTVLTWGSPEYPEDFFHLADPPPLLFLRGRAELLKRRPSVTIVGSRRVTVRGREVAREMGRTLAREGAVVVSGLALGTDGEAHRGALGAGGDTVAVLGTGADVPYPRTHSRLFRTIAERGLLVSEFAPGTNAAPYHFPRRNRLLAALGGDGVVVVEAGTRSGSLITVDHALDLGRDVWAVPGPIDGPACAGSNALLSDGAQALVSIEDFAARVRMRGIVRDASADAGDPLPAHADDSLPCHPDEFLLRHLADGPLQPADLAGRSGRSVADVLAALTTLELRGRVVRLPGQRYRRAA